MSGDATATAKNIIASQLLWRISVAGDPIVLLCAVALAPIFYVLLRPVSKTLALLAVFLNLVELAIDGANKLNLLAALSLLGGAGYIPKILGVLMQIAGLSYLANSFALLLAPTFAAMIFPAVLVPAFIGESSLCLWLIVKGVNVPKWEEKSTAWGVGGA